MTILEIIAKVAGLAGPELVEILTAAKEKLPDLAPKIDEWLTTLQNAVAPGNLVALAEALPSELAAIGRGQFDGKKHPEDVI